MVRLKSKTLIKLAVIAVCAVSLSLSWRSVSATPSQEGVNVVPFGAPVAEKLGSNDGVSLIIHFTGDIHGDLDACT